MNKIKTLLPGVIFALTLSGIAIYATSFPIFKQFGLSSAIIAIIGGMLLGNTLYPKIAKTLASGVDYTKQRILRLAIILFGLKLTLQDIIEVGSAGILIDMSIVISTFFITFYVGKKILKLDEQTTILIGSGCSICGAAAILGTAPVIISQKDTSLENIGKISVAISTVVVFGTIAMFLYPIFYATVAPIWHINDTAFGIYIGSTIHEVAQVAGAGEAINANVLAGAVISKMIRVLMLAPFLIALSYWLAKRPHASTKHGCAPQQKIIIPWFAIGFILMTCVASTKIIPASVQNILIVLDNLLLTAAMAALGLTTHYSVFRKAGYKPMLLAAIIFIWLILGGAMINAFFQWLCY